MDNVKVDNIDSTAVKVLSNKVTLQIQEEAKSDSIQDFRVIILEPINGSIKHFNYISENDFRQALALKEGIGITEIVMGTVELLVGLLTLIAGVLTFNPTLVVGGVLTATSGALSITAGAIRPVYPELSEKLGYSAIALGTAGMMFSIYGGYRAGIHASRMLGKVANGRILHSQTLNSANYQMQTLGAATPIPSNAVGGFNRFYGGPGFLMQVIARGAGHATTRGVNAAIGTVGGAGASFAGVNAGYWHSFKVRAKLTRQLNLQKMISGSLD